MRQPTSSSLASQFPPEARFLQQRDVSIGLRWHTGRGSVLSLAIEATILGFLVLSALMVAEVPPSAPSPSHTQGTPGTNVLGEVLTGACSGVKVKHEVLDAGMAALAAQTVPCLPERCPCLLAKWRGGQRGL